MKSLKHPSKNYYIYQEAITHEERQKEMKTERQGQVERKRKKERETRNGNRPAGDPNTGVVRQIFKYGV